MIEAMERSAPIFIAGHRGLVGSAIVRKLTSMGFQNLLLADRGQLDLTDQRAVDGYFAENEPAFVFLAAARVGGIHANQAYAAEFIRENLALQTNVIHSAWRHGTRKLMFLGSSCIYPRECPQPMREEHLLTGPLEPTNQWYAVAKIAGIKMCQAYRKQYGFDAICAMPTNLYGPFDNFHGLNSHVVPALVRRFHDARAAGASEVTVWGSGTPRRELMHVDDLAAGLVFLMEHYGSDEIINVGSGDEIRIDELAAMIAAAVGFEGNIRFDDSRPDGAPRKLLDSQRIRSLGWSPAIGLEVGLVDTYRWFASQVSTAALRGEVGR